MQPLLSDGFLNWINSTDFSEKTILELGSGNSTIFFSEKFKVVNTYEHNEEWIRYIDLEIKTKNIKNINVNKLTKNIFDEKSFLNLVKEADVFLVDNAPHFIKRMEFVLFIHKNKKENSIIVLDNGDWNVNAYEFLRKHYYCLDYLRIEDGNLTETSVFFHKRFINKSMI